MTRILLFTGKGGVGKTTVAAATAAHAARRGARTLALSTDPAHSLADAFDAPLATEVRELAPGLWGQQLDAQDRMEESWGEIRDWLAEVFDWAGVDAVEAEELAMLPGLEEIFALTDIGRFERSGDYDLIVVDCAPTAETIRFLSLPDVLGWYMDRLFPATRRVNRVVAPVLTRVARLPAASDGVFRSTQRFYEQLGEVKALLGDPARTSVRLVVNPERIVIAEARRTFTYLSLFGYRVDAVVANRPCPTTSKTPTSCDGRSCTVATSARSRRRSRRSRCCGPDWRPTSSSGSTRFKPFAAALYGERDPLDRFAEAEPLHVARRGEEVDLVLALPFTEREELELGRHGDELLIRVGPYRRAVLLPDVLRRRQVRSASLDGGSLRVTFA